MTPLLTVREAAKLLALSEDTVYRLVETRQLSCTRVGVGQKRSKIAFEETHISAYKARREQRALADIKPEPVRAPSPRRSLADLPEASRYA